MMQEETCHVAIKKLADSFTEFVKDESGATAIEYGLIAALIGMGTLVGMNTFASGQESAWNELTSKVETTIS